MGITIFYQGSLDDVEQYPAFESSVKDWISELGGEYKLIADLDAAAEAKRARNSLPPRSPQRSTFRGFIVTMHPEHEPLSLLVSPQGHFVSLVTLILESRGELVKETDEPELCFLKTQYGPVDSHIAVVELLSRIKATYSSNLQVNDESGYWKHRNRNQLAHKLGFLSSIIEQFTDGVRQYPLNAEAAEDPEIVVERIKRIAEKIQDDVTDDGYPIEIQVVTLDDINKSPNSLYEMSFETIESRDDLEPQEPTEDELQIEKLFRHSYSDQKEFKTQIQHFMAGGLSFDEALKQTLLDRGLPPPVYSTTQPGLDITKEINSSNNVNMPPIVELDQLIRLVDPDMNQLGQFHRRSSTDLPAPYAELLAHDEHMTVTVEAFHKSRVLVDVLKSWTEGDFYMREILLRKNDDGAVIQYGVVRLRLDALDEGPRNAILSEMIPLGRVLIEHDVLRNVELVELWEIAVGPRLATHFGCSQGTITYGRTAMIYFEDQPALELIEIVRPELHRLPE